jgi:hypothetical protein
LLTVCVTRIFLGTPHVHAEHSIISFDSDIEYVITTESPTGSIHTFTRCLATGDIDADGDIDVVVCDRFNDHLVFLLNDGTGTFSQGSSVLATGEFINRIILLEDFNDDGMLDIATATASDFFDDGLAVYLNLGVSINKPNEWKGYGTRSVYATGDNPHWIDAVDVDNDGDKDILIADYGDWKSDSETGWSVLLNDGFGIFGTRIPFNLGVNAACISIVGAELYGSEYPDFAVSGFSSRIHLYENLGVDDAGNWLGATYKEAIQTESCIGSIRSLDIENDGDNDLVVGHRCRPQLTILVNDGVGNFEYTAMEVQNWVELAEPADVDGDGFTDVTLIPKYSGQLVVLQNDGNGNFFEVFTSSVDKSSQPKFMAYADVDNDGDLDALVVNSYLGYDFGSVKVFMNTTELCSNADLTGDCLVDINDLLQCIEAWNNSCDACPEDLDGDGLVTVHDLLIIIAAWT